MRFHRGFTCDDLPKGNCCKFAVARFPLMLRDLNTSTLSGLAVFGEQGFEDRRAVFIRPSIDAGLQPLHALNSWQCVLTDSTNLVEEAGSYLGNP